MLDCLQLNKLLSPLFNDELWGFSKVSKKKKKLLIRKAVIDEEDNM